jgi:ABC-2 type transport system ATP-binding protein
MRRKLSFIQALCHEPEILILDEPTTGMDAHFLVTLAEIIKNRSESGNTTWISGNDPDWIAGVASRVAFMGNGRIITEGSVSGLVSAVSPYQEIRAVLSCPRELPTIDFDGLQSFHQQGDTIHALIEHKPELVTEMMERIVTLGGEIQSLEVKQSTLRDAFLLKTGKTLDE